jgi:drug/metabolite transporter (DMT)-like permease
VELLRRMSVFFVSITSNLEPVWGIILAGVLLGELDQLKPSFWLGSAIVLTSVMAYPWLKGRPKLFR